MIGFVRYERSLNIDGRICELKINAAYCKLLLRDLGLLDLGSGSCKSS